MALTREVVRVNQAQDLERNSTWAITLVTGGDVTQAVTFPAQSGFSGVNDVLLSCLVDLVSGKGQLTVNVDQSPDGSSWTNVASFTFTDLVMAKGGGADRKIVVGPNDQLRVTATPAGGHWVVRSVTAVLGILETSGGSGGVIATDTLWDLAGDLAVGSGPDTAQRLPVGTQGQLLSVDTTLPLKLKWINPPSLGNITSDLVVNNYWHVRAADGVMEWAPGNAVWDMSLSRFGPNSIQVAGEFRAHTLTVDTVGNWLYFGADYAVGLRRDPTSGGLYTNVGLVSGGNLTAVGGSLIFGTAADASLYRNGPSALQTGGTLAVMGISFAGWHTSPNAWSVALGTPQDGLTFGGDTQLYRAAANTIVSPNLQANGWIIASSDYYLRNNGGHLYMGTSDDTWVYRKNAQIVGIHTNLDIDGNLNAWTDNILLGNLGTVSGLGTGGGLMIQGAIFMYDGSKWIANVPIQATALLGPVASEAPPTGTTPPASPKPYTRWVYSDGTVYWEFIYRPDLDSTYPWQFTGGAMWEQNTTGFAVDFTAPRAGVYRAEGGGTNYSTGGGGASYVDLPNGIRLQTGNYSAGWATVTSTLAVGGGIHSGTNSANGGQGALSLSVVPVKIA